MPGDRDSQTQKWAGVLAVVIDRQHTRACYKRYHLTRYYWGQEPP